MILYSKNMYYWLVLLMAITFPFMGTCEEKVLTDAILLHKLKSGTLSEKSQSFFELSKSSSDLCDLLSPLLESSDAELRQRALSIIGKTKSRLCRTKIENTCLKDKDPVIRQYALVALGNLAMPESMDLVENIFHRDPSIDVRIVACKVLAVILPSEAIPILKASLNEAQPEIQANIAATLGYLNDETGLDIALSLLSHPDGNIRSQAAQALGYIGSTNSLDILEKQSEKEFGDVKQKIKEALFRINLKQMPTPKKLLTLEAALGSTDGTIRRCAANEITRINSSEIVPLLKRKLSDSEFIGREEIKAALNFIEGL